MIPSLPKIILPAGDHIFHTWVYGDISNSNNDSDFTDMYREKSTVLGHKEVVSSFLLVNF